MKAPSSMTQPLPEAETILPKYFLPTINHVVIGRGKKSYNHIGNIMFQSAIHSRLEEYSKAKTKNAKSSILRDIVQRVHATGGFVKEDLARGRWMTAGTTMAREKVSQTFRDMLSDGYKSSRAAKRKRRQEQLVASSTEELTLPARDSTFAGNKRRRQSGVTTTPCPMTAIDKTIFSSQKKVGVDFDEFQPIPYDSCSESDLWANLHGLLTSPDTLGEAAPSSLLEPFLFLEEDCGLADEGLLQSALSHKVEEDEFSSRVFEVVPDLPELTLTQKTATAVTA